MFRTSIVGAASALAVISAASAHVTLEVQQTPVGASYKAVLRVPHGCEGSPTTALRVRMPEGVIGVKPMPKPGWKLDTVSGAYPRPYTLHGVKLTEGVTEIAWSGGYLPDAYYDEFVFTGVVADTLQPGTTIYFPVVQECEKGVHRWIEVPAGDDGHGGDSATSSEPAPGLKLLPKR